MDSQLVIGGADRFEAQAEANEALIRRAASAGDWDAMIPSVARMHRRPIGGSVGRAVLQASLGSFFSGPKGGGGGAGTIAVEDGPGKGVISIGRLVVRWPAPRTGPNPVFRKVLPALEHSRGATDGQPAPAGFGQALRSSSGHPLPTTVRAKMEQAFGGADLSAVRIHTDGRAQALTQQVHAKAFATGNDVFFNQGQFDPTSPKGLALLGHELTHVLQQRAGASLLEGAPPVRRSPLESPLGRGGLLEAQGARSVARAAAPASTIQRKADRMVRRSASSSSSGGGPAAGGKGLLLPGGAPRTTRGQVLISSLRVTVTEGGPPPAMELVSGKGAEAGLAPDGFGALLGGSAGTPLPESLGAQLGALLGADFSDVRVHTGGAAARAAQAVSAEAFTLGRDIYFGEGRWDPHSPRGVALIGHELTHVAQGRGGARSISAKELQRKAVEGERAPVARALRKKDELTVAGHDALERQALANERVLLQAFSGGMRPVVTRSHDPTLTRGAITGPLLRASPGYPGALARKVDPEATPGVPAPGEVPAVSDGILDDAVGFLKSIGPALGTAADVAVGFVPIAGDVYDVICGLIGRAIFTWQELDVLDRVLCIAGVIPIPFISGGILRRGKKVAAWLLKKAGVDVIAAFRKVVPIALDFIKKTWAKAKEMLGRVVKKMPWDVFQDFGKRMKTKFNAIRQGSDVEKVKALEGGVSELEGMIAKHGYKTNVQSFFEFKALRIQGFSASEAHSLMKRFRGGEAVEGFGWHFTNRVGGQGITTSQQMYARTGVAGKGVYMGATPTPSAAQRNLVWGIGPDSDVRIPVKLEGKDAFSAVYPTKTHIVELAGDAMPLTGKIDHLKPTHSAWKRAWDRYHYAAFVGAVGATATAAAAYQLFQSMLFKGGDREDEALDDEELAERLRSEGADPRLLRDPGPGLPLELSLRNRLEAFLGADLSGVRVHSGAAAGRLAAAMGAEAFTQGTRIFLGEGANLGTPEGVGTLVHEATHAVQAERGRLIGPASPMLTRTLESEAYATERAFHQGALPALSPSGSLGARAPRAVAAPSARAERTPTPPRLVVRETPQAQEEVPAPEAAPVNGRGVLKKEAESKDPVQRVMATWRVVDMSREDFLEECTERVRELMREEIEADAQRGATNLAWSYDAPLA